MTKEQEQRAFELFEQLLDLDDAAQAAFLDERCQDDALRRRVEAMLRALRSAENNL